MNAIQIIGSILINAGFVLFFSLAYGRIGILYGGYLGGLCSYILALYPILFPLFIYITIFNLIKILFHIYRYQDQYKNGYILITNQYVALFLDRPLYFFLF